MKLKPLSIEYKTALVITPVVTGTPFQQKYINQIEMLQRMPRTSAKSDCGVTHPTRQCCPRRVSGFVPLLFPAD